MLTQPGTLTVGVKLVAVVMYIHLYLTEQIGWSSIGTTYKIPCALVLGLMSTQYMASCFPYMLSTTNPFSMFRCWRLLSFVPIFIVIIVELRSQEVYLAASDLVSYLPLHIHTFSGRSRICAAVPKHRTITRTQNEKKNYEKSMKKKKKKKCCWGVWSSTPLCFILPCASYACMYELVPLVTSSWAKLHLHVLAYTLELVLQFNPHGVSTTFCF